MVQTFPNIPATEEVRDSRANILQRDETLRSNFSGPTAPASPVPGQDWEDTSSDPPVSKRWDDANEVWRVLGSNILDDDDTLGGVSPSDTVAPTQAAAKAYADQLLAASDAQRFLGVIDCSGNPNYPAANAGDTYVVSVAGKIGGASGVNVEVNDRLMCKADSTASGNHATVGAQWAITQANIDGAVVGPASVTADRFARFDGTTGKLIKGDVSLDTDGALAANSDSVVPSQQAVKEYVDTVAALKANLASPTFTGTPAAPTPAEHDDDTSLATTAYVMRVIKNVIGMTPEMFGALGNGGDDLTALQAWVTAIKSSPRRTGFLAAKIYGTTGKIGTIDVSGVKIYGAGRMSSHDVGSPTVGSVIKALSGSGYGVLDVAPVTGASAQRLDDVELVGFSIDCNSVADYGIDFRSCLNFRLEVACIEAKTTAGLVMGVVATLGEARDCQRGAIRFTGRQFANAVPGLLLTGDSGANTSKNNFFEVDVGQDDAIGIVCSNSDNNNWWDIRIGYAGGSATYGMECRGGATEPESCRQEKIWKYSAQKPLVARGTEGGTYAYPSIGIEIFYLDVANGTPDPVEGTGASIYSEHWRSSNPTFVAGSGTITAATLTLRWRRLRGKVEFEFSLVCTTNGTGGGGYVRITMPVAHKSGTGFEAVFATKETGATGLIGSAIIVQNSANLDLQTWNGGYPLADGYTIKGAGQYATADT